MNGRGALKGWVWTDGHWVGSLDKVETVHYWNGSVHRTRALAIRDGLRVYGSDDFNVARITNGAIDWWGWMDEPHPLDDAEAFAKSYGFTLAVIDTRTPSPDPDPITSIPLHARAGYPSADAMFDGLERRTEG